MEFGEAESPKVVLVEGTKAISSAAGVYRHSQADSFCRELSVWKDRIRIDKPGEVFHDRQRMTKTESIKIWATCKAEWYAPLPRGQSGSGPTLGYLLLTVEL
jgi:hypothetical protein